MAAESKTYTGGCHCGANKFSVPISPPIGSPERKLSNCNCSICARNGYIFIFVAKEDIDWKAGSLEALTEYTFNKNYFRHYFCPTCGTSMCVNAEGKVGLNARVLEDVEVQKLEISNTYDGKSI